MYESCLSFEALISVLAEPKNSHSNSVLNCCSLVFLIVSSFHFSSLPGTSLQCTSIGM